MILSFRSRALRRFWEKDDERGVRADWIERVGFILDALDRAEAPGDMNVPTLNFHALRGDLSGRYSVLVSRNWRITFAWKGVDAVDVDLEDYHGR